MPLVPITISPDDFEIHSRKMHSKDSSCKWIVCACLVILLLLLLSQTNFCKQHALTAPMKSGLKAEVKEIKGVPGKDVHANKNFADFDVTNLTPCTEGDNACVNYKQPSTELEQQKKRNDEAVKQYKAQNPNAVFMIFAPWCPHCHKAMGDFCQASKESKEEFAVINAELVSRELLMGDSFDVSHFPFIVKCNKDGTDVVLKTQATKENIKNLQAAGADANEQLKMMF